MKKILMLWMVLCMSVIFMPRTLWAEPPDVAPAETVVAEDAMPVQAVQPMDLQIVQRGDSVYVIVDGQSAAFYLPSESKAGKALGVTGVVLALILSILAWYKSARLHRLARDKIN